MTPEGAVKRDIKKFLNDLEDCWWFMPATGGFGKSGVPDFIVCYWGRFFAIEAKAPGGRLTELQKGQIAEINECGGKAVMCNDVNQLKDFFK